MRLGIAIESGEFYMILYKMGDILHLLTIYSSVVL